MLIASWFVHAMTLWACMQVLNCLVACNNKGDVAVSAFGQSQLLWLPGIAGASRSEGQQERPSEGEEGLQGTVTLQVGKALFTYIWNWRSIPELNQSHERSTYPVLCCLLLSLSGPGTHHTQPTLPPHHQAYQQQ